MVKSRIVVEKPDLESFVLRQEERIYKRISKEEITRNFQFHFFFYFLLLLNLILKYFFNFEYTERLNFKTSEGDE